jgi:putative transcriptional regulator
VAPGILYALLLREDEGQLGLLRVRPGASVPQHGHRGSELICVLEGAFEDGAERYAAGDFSAAGDRHSHSQRADAAQGCLCLIATHGRLRFGTLLARLWQPLMPF